MPTSDHHNINAIVTLVTQLGPRRILDIGCGFGKYGVLLREYLDIWHQRLLPDEWQVTLDGIEAFPAYRNPIHDYVYNTVHYGDAQEILHNLGEYDLVLLADVIEHFEKEEAMRLVSECFLHSEVVLVSTPQEFYAQGAINNNSYEAHLHLWTKNEFPSNIHVRTIPAVSCNIFVGSRQPLDRSIFNLTEPDDYLYLRSRKKLGSMGWPVSTGLRVLNRLFA
jgi:SAM-dependent methyltransferase